MYVFIIELVHTEVAFVLLYLCDDDIVLLWR